MRSFRKFFAVVLASLLFLYSMSPSLADGENWLTGWTYRKSITITGSTGAGTNYQFNVTVHYGSGTDSDTDIYTSSHCETDFADIRFTDNDGDTLLSAWNESQTDSDNVVAWFKVTDDVSSGSVTVYLYYGNSGASAYWDGYNTFLRWDDFDDDYSDGDPLNSTRGWDDNGNGIFEIEVNPSGSGLVGEMYNDAGGTSGMRMTHSASGYTNVSVHFDYRVTVAGDADLLWYYMQLTGGTVFWLTTRSFGGDWEFYNGSYYDFSPSLSISADTWYRYEVRFRNNDVAVFVDGGSTAYVGDYRETPTAGAERWVFNLANALDSVFIDDFFIRKYIESEPYISSIGSEESTIEYIYVTWQFNDGGIFQMNGTSLTNSSSEIQYNNGTLFMLLATVSNSSYVWNNFTWTQSNSTTNPYNLTLYANSSVWCYWGSAGGGYEAGWFLAGLIVVIICMVIGYVLFKEAR